MNDDDLQLADDDDFIPPQPSAAPHEWIRQPNEVEQEPEKPPQLTPSSSLYDALAEYRYCGREKAQTTINRMLAAVRALEISLGHEPRFRDLTNRNLAKLVQDRRANGRAENTICFETVKLRTLANWGVKRGYCEEVDYLGPLRQFDAPEAFSPAELSALFTAAANYKDMMGRTPGNVYLTALLRVLYDTGERIGAIHALKWDAIDFTAKSIVFRAATRKGRRAGRTAGITAETADVLRQLQFWNEDGPFLGLTNAKTIHRHWRFLVDKAGMIPSRRRGTHAVRRSHASLLKVAGGDATASLGHSSDAVTRDHYYDPRITETVRPCDMLPDFTPKPEQPKRPWWKVW